MNVGDESDQYVDFFRHYSYQGSKRNLKMENPCRQVHLQLRNFLKLRQNNPMRSSYVWFLLIWLCP